MRLAILQAGGPPEPLRPRFGSYGDMFNALLGEGWEWRVYDVQQGQWPTRPEDHQGYIVTGSSSGVYEGEPWIGALMEFLRAARGRARLVGVCFGHQAMAQAFGGQVIKSPKGWGVGENEYRVLIREPWMDGEVDTIRLPASHQDQVVDAPPGAEVWAASDFTPFAGLIYRADRAISIQPHPEFLPAYAISLIETRRDGPLTPEQADRAIASYAEPDDRTRVGGWIGAFLQSVR